MTYTITPNPTFNSLEISFDKKPPQAIIEALKTLRFRWHGVKRLWYGYAKEEALRKALGEEIPEAPKATAPKVTAPKAPEVIKDKRTGKVRYYKAIVQNGKKRFVESWGEPMTIELPESKMKVACEFVKGDGWKITDITTGILMQNGAIKNKKALEAYIKNPDYIQSVNRITATDFYKNSALELAEYINSFTKNA